MAKIKNIYYAGIFLISLATLALEVSLIRLFSVMQWYHFAFMVVSIALFGIAAAGTFLSIKKLRNPLFISSILFSITTIAGFLAVNQITFDPFKAMLDYSHVFKLLLYYLLLGLPFFFFGIIIAFVFSKYQQKSGTIYFYNLLGSGIGAIAALPLLALFGQKTIIAVALIGLFSSICFTKKRKAMALISLLSLVLLALPFSISMSEYKELNLALNFPGSKLLHTQWNSFSRVDVVNSSFTRYAPGISGEFRGALPPQLGITVDGAGMNSITAPVDLTFVNYLPTSIAFSLIESPKTLVINSGAGLDVLTALHHNADVTALETSPIVIDLLKTKYKDFSGSIYDKADVHLGEGRAFVKKAQAYDVIIISLAGNVLSSAAGMYSLSENYLLTADAFKDYYNSLTDNGILVITRWLLYPPRESLRLFSLGLEIENAENKMAMFRSWTTVTFLLSKKNLDEERVESIKAFTEKNKFDIIYLPKQFSFEPNKHGKFESAYYFDSINEILKDKKAFYENYLFDVSPVSDERPFYFNFFKWGKLPELYKAIGQKWQPFFDSGFLIMFILFQAIILSLIFILLPLKVFRKFKANKIALIYFFCIGIAFMFIELVLIQKYILFLGHVIYAISSVIFAVLLFSSIGSLVSQKYKVKKLNKIILVLAGLIILYAVCLPLLLSTLIQLNLIIKIIIGAVIIAPVAFVMGMPFPLGIRAIHKGYIPWSWAINGSASVLSSIIAILLALSFGYSAVLVLAAGFYLVGLWSIKRELK